MNDSTSNTGGALQQDRGRAAEVDWRRLAQEATPGPWYVGAQNDSLCVINKPPPRGDYDSELQVIVAVGPTRTDEANARFIAGARTAVPELLKEVDRLNDRVHVLECQKRDLETSLRAVRRHLDRLAGVQE
jgi:hypothetical protein